MKHTKTAGSIIRVVIDELDTTDDDDEEHDIVGDGNKEYEKRGGLPTTIPLFTSHCHLQL